MPESRARLRVELRPARALMVLGRDGRRVKLEGTGAPSGCNKAARTDCRDRVRGAVDVGFRPGPDSPHDSFFKTARTKGEVPSALSICASLERFGSEV